MSDPRELPQLVTELVDMSKEYLRQETIEPARRLGKVAGFGLAAGVLFSIGALLLAIAALRLVVDLLPDTELWSVLGYVIATLLAGGAAALIVQRAQASTQAVSQPSNRVDLDAPSS